MAWGTLLLPFRVLSRCCELKVDERKGAENAVEVGQEGYVKHKKLKSLHTIWGTASHVLFNIRIHCESRLQVAFWGFLCTARCFLPFVNALL